MEMRVGDLAALFGYESLFFFTNKITFDRLHQRRDALSAAADEKREGNYQFEIDAALLSHEPNKHRINGSS